VLGPIFDAFFAAHTAPLALVSHPFIERLIGTVRREYLDRTLFWNALDLEHKLQAFSHYCNRSHMNQSRRPKILNEWLKRSDRILAALRSYSHPGLARKKTVRAVRRRS
jgi:hypothetical protein